MKGKRHTPEQIVRKLREADRPQAATPAEVQVRVTRRFPTILLRLVGLSDLTVSAQANAAPRAP